MKIKLSKLNSKEMMPGYHGKLIHTQNMSLVFWKLEEGAIVPEHSPSNEQVMQVLKGHFEFTLSGTTILYSSVDLVIISPMSHPSGKALTACKIMDIFSPQGRRIAKTTPIH
ncbi:hypothetical protein KCTC52924_02061 [Arenibacter antarcticus]|uniref:Cupin domain-containing protein n=1 Tax=Arenibacter antarcticus TaxID=2040469 RepID=A0ABW5VCU3_9FLAO|nr:cupin domain-containing protein [Arenibacter sp. H213]MCM4168486.1 cupin domain-containing protein [Arenibacter sp. H213]